MIQCSSQRRQADLGQVAQERVRVGFERFQREKRQGLPGQPRKGRLFLWGSQGIPSFGMCSRCGAPLGKLTAFGRAILAARSGSSHPAFQVRAEATHRGSKLVSVVVSPRF